MRLNEIDESQSLEELFITHSFVKENTLYICLIQIIIRNKVVKMNSNL